ncbi:hypothetical protein [Nocardioides aequoreus]|uniref:hypothetical protein n=1 Tax=Nocardioides aequoreus TaxID=397278 RepID=UPI0012F6DF13|nr:hypothetical protein [Nocardioides aequoreus]
MTKKTTARLALILFVPIAACGLFWFLSDSDPEVANGEEGTLLVAAGDRLLAPQDYTGYAAAGAVVNRLESGCIGLQYESGRQTVALWPAGTELSGNTISFRGRELRLGQRLPEDVGLLEGGKVADLEWAREKVDTRCSAINVEIIVAEPK